MLNELRGELWYLCSICEVPLKYEILICWAGCMSFSGADKTVILSCSKVMSQNKHLNLWKRACALGVVKGSGVKHAWNFRSGWLRYNVPKYRWKIFMMVLRFFILSVTELNSPVFSYPPGLSLNLLPDKCRYRRGKKRLLKELFCILLPYRLTCPTWF